MKLGVCMQLIRPARTYNALCIGTVLKSRGIVPVMVRAFLSTDKYLLVLLQKILMCFRWLNSPVPINDVGCAANLWFMLKILHDLWLCSIGIYLVLVNVANRHVFLADGISGLLDIPGNVAQGDY